MLAQIVTSLDWLTCVMVYWFPPWTYRTHGFYALYPILKPFWWYIFWFRNGLDLPGWLSLPVLYSHILLRQVDLLWWEKCSINKNNKVLCKNHTSRVGEKATQTRQLRSNSPTYITAHLYNPTSLEHYATVVHLLLERFRSMFKCLTVNVDVTLTSHIAPNLNVHGKLSVFMNV